MMRSAICVPPESLRSSYGGAEQVIYKSGDDGQGSVIVTFENGVLIQKVQFGLG